MQKPPGHARPFSRQPLTRQHVRDLARQTLEPLDFVHALWEGGSTAFGRDDAWSDVDLQVVVDDERVADALAAVEQAFEKAVGIEVVYPVPEPAWHGHAQRFYRFRGQEPWLMLDLCVMKRSSSNLYLEREIHGEAVFLFDKIALAAAPRPLDREAWDAKLRARVEALSARVGMLAILADKEVRRRHAIDAIAFYQSLVIAPLVELLRIRHDPWRHNFGLRHLHEALPPGAAKKIEELLYVRNLPDLQTKQRAALRWFDELATELRRAPKLMFSLAGPAAPKPAATKAASPAARRTR